MLGFTIAHVRGDSMSPRLHDGQLKLFRRRTRYKVGEIILVDHPHYGLVIKQVAALTEMSVRLQGLNPHSVSEDSMGDVPLDRIAGRLVG
ncbi:MAG: S24/S26 family peptidase [Pseudomonadota bacterium]